MSYLNSLSKEELIKILEIREMQPKKQLSDTEDAVVNLRNYLTNQKLDYSREHFGMILLDNRNKILEIEIIFTGTIDKSVIEMREIFKILFKYDRCKNFIIFHNHPSGNLKPSKNDIDITHKIDKLATEIGFNLIEHIIISDYGVDYQSLNPYL